MKIKEALELTITQNCETCQHNDKGVCDVVEEKIGSGEEYCSQIWADINSKDGIYDNIYYRNTRIR